MMLHKLNHVKRLYTLYRLIWLRVQPNGGFCEQGNKISNSIKYGEFLEELLRVSAS